jgi:trans-2,3-dihydro-3-hydroxyanthranilate isomerase
MTSHAFETVDVFTESRFGGNPLAVFTDGRGIADAEMQALAFEFNLSETTFVLPPADPANTARVRIFNRTAEMAFAGHPMIGTAFVLARTTHREATQLRFEVPAGLAVVDIERRDGEVVGAKVAAPQPVSFGRTFTPGEIAPCLGIAPTDIITTTHAPIVATVGNPFTCIEIKPEALARCVPDIRAHAAIRDADPSLNGRFALYVYARDGEDVRARMFAPLAGTWEDSATGSGATPLAGLLLHHSGRDQLAFDIRQGVEMGRPSLLSVTARRDGDAIRTTVAGRCVAMFTGEVCL